MVGAGVGADDDGLIGHVTQDGVVRGSGHNDPDDTGTVVREGAGEGHGAGSLTQDGKTGVAEGREGPARFVRVVGEEVDLVGKTGLDTAIEDNVVTGVDEPEVTVGPQGLDKDLQTPPGLLTEDLTQALLGVPALKERVDRAEDPVGVCPTDLKARRRV